MPEHTPEQAALVADAFDSLLNAMEPASIEQMDQALKDKLIAAQQTIEGWTTAAQGSEYNNAVGGPGEQ